MPVSSETSISGPYTPNGETTSFPFDFKAASASEVVATDGDGNIISTALYSVTLDSDEGGTLTFGTAPEVADYPEIYVLSEPELTQPSDFDNAGPSFNPAALTRAIDRAAIRDLKLNRDIGRALKLPFGEVAVTFPGVAERANKYISFLPNGDVLMSSGTGADSGLREDIASPAGGAMVGMKRVPTANTRTVEAMIAEMGLSIADFGADGTGTDPAADTAAIIAAHDALPAEGGLIRIPDGIYEFNDTITFTKRVVLRGNGCSTLAGGVARSQIYKAAGVSGPLLEIEALDTFIENIGFEGKPGNIGDGIHIKAGRNIMRNVSVHRMEQDNIRIGGTEQLNCNHYLHDHVFTKEAGRYCYHVHDEYYINQAGVPGDVGANCNHGMISHIDAGWAGDDGIVVHGAWYTTVFASLVQECAGDGIHVIGSGQNGARYTKIIAGEQNENNVGFNINNSGYQTEMYGVTPGVAAKLNNVGVGRIIMASGLSEIDVLRVTNILTSDRPTAGSVVYPFVAESTGNVGAGRGAGIEFKVPNGSGTSRVGGRQSVQQEATNIERWSWSVNISGAMTEVLEFSGQQLALRPITNGTIACGGATKQWSWGYFGSGIRVNNIQVLGAQGAAVANATDAASVITQLNLLLARCRAHGIIAT